MEQSNNNEPYPPIKELYLYDRIPYKQLSLADIFSACQIKFDKEKQQFLFILEQSIDMNEIVPISFVSRLTINVPQSC